MMDMSRAPSGIATPSDQVSMKSSQQSFHGAASEPMPKNCHGANGREPRPSEATKQDSRKMTMHTRVIVRGRLGSSPRALARSINVTETASIREMADEMAAIRTRA